MIRVAIDAMAGTLGPEPIMKV